MNEELRSTAEELETSQEELQSVNEELHTVNQELKVKVEEVSHASDDLRNLMSSTDIGTIFVDRGFRVKLFTPRARHVFNLIDADVGRPLSDITHKLVVADLAADMVSVLESAQSVEREVQTRDGAWYVMRLLPYRTAEDRIEGVVLTFVDNTARHRATQSLLDSEARQRFLVGLNDAIVPLSDAKEIVRAALTRTAEHLRAGRVSYDEIDPVEQTATTLWMGASAEDPAGGGTYDLRRFPATLEHSQSCALVVPDVQASTTLSQAEREAYAEAHVAAFCLIALDRNGVRNVHFTVSQSQPREWTPFEVSLVREAAERTLVAVQRARAEAALRTNENRMRAQKEALQDTVRGAPLYESLNILARLVASETAGEARVAFYTADPDGRHLHPVRGAGTMPDDYLTEVDTFVAGDESLACGLAMPRGEPVVTADVAADPSWKPWLRLAEQYDFRSCWSFPIKRGGREPFGTFAMYFREPRAATADDHARAEIVTQTAAAIMSSHVGANRQQFLQRLVSATEEERQRIARELHDEMGQHTTALRVRLQSIQARPEDIGELQAILARIDQSIDRLTLELRAPGLDQLGLHGAIATLTDEFSSASGIRVATHLGIDVGDRFSDAIESTIYRVVQESLTNVWKHSSAKMVSVIVERERGFLRLIVEDDGDGFDAAATFGDLVPPRGRFGLLGMRERLSLVQGTLSVESEPGRGTTIYARVPLTGKERPS